MKDPIDMILKARKEGEPTFTIRAKDRHSTHLLMVYELLLDQGNADPEYYREIQRFRHQFQDWQEAHPDKVKEPD